MTTTPEAWHEEVRTAAMAGDREGLLRLYAQADVLFGDQASGMWAEALSGLDASAQTG